MQKIHRTDPVFLTDGKHDDIYKINYKRLYKLLQTFVYIRISQINIMVGFNVYAQYIGKIKKSLIKRSK